MDSTDTLYVLRLAEDSLQKKPQTSWTPYFSVDSIEGVQTIPPRTVTAVDGAGPVIWRVVKTVENAEDRSKDRVRVIFSEKIVDSAGMTITVNTAPSALFNVYLRTAEGDYVLDTVKLSGIANIIGVPGDSIVEFVMTNGSDLGPTNYFSINTGSGIVADKAGGNAPVPDNRKVRVEIVGNTTQQIAAIPNPTRPTFRHTSPGEFNAWHEPQAWRWTRDEGSGAVLRFTLVIRDINDDQRIKIMVKVYDVVGNLVQTTQENDLLNPSGNGTRIPRDAGIYTVDLYWNGSNKNGMAVAPGVYRVVVYLDYASSKYEDVRVYTMVGIGK
jgi:hypothetical protein